MHGDIVHIFTFLSKAPRQRQRPQGSVKRAPDIATAKQKAEHTLRACQAK